MDSAELITRCVQSERKRTKESTPSFFSSAHGKSESFCKLEQECPKCKMKLGGSLEEPDMRILVASFNCTKASRGGFVCLVLCVFFLATTLYSVCRSKDFAKVAASLGGGLVAQRRSWGRSRQSYPRAGEPFLGNPMDFLYNLCELCSRGGIRAVSPF